MRTTRTITASLAAVLGAAALAGPAAAGPNDAQSTSTPSHAGKSLQDFRTPDAKDAGTANVYVPPAELSPDTTPVAPPPTCSANQQPIGQPDQAVSASSSGFDWETPPAWAPPRPRCSRLPSPAWLGCAAGAPQGPARRHPLAPASRTPVRELRTGTASVPHPLRFNLPWRLA